MTFSALLSREPRGIKGKLNVYFDLTGIAGARELLKPHHLLSAEHTACVGSHAFPAEGIEIRAADGAGGPFT
jgi:hypothetical protein